MVSSLEQTLDDDFGSNTQEQSDSQSIESAEHTSNESSSWYNQQQPASTRSVEDSSEKLYDLLLKILKVLDDQAYRDAERNRRLEQLRNPGVLSLEHDYDDSSLENTNGSGVH
ncbi:AAEL008820-PA [Aedes aegypti]|nr:AAEL008820-PA [Aedes aegypti]